MSQIAQASTIESSSLIASRCRLIYDPPDLKLDNEIAYNRGWALLVPSAAGVYLIRDLRGWLYIGMAAHLRRRFDQHLAGSHNDRLVRALARPVGETRFGWVETPEPGPLERSLIRALRPLCNDRLYLTGQQ